MSASPDTRPATYFFLSYGHTAPLADAEEPADYWVRRLFDDLCGAVRSAARLGSGGRVGFFDGVLEAGADWKARIVEELGAAEVFVPLYSPGYFAMSWPGREWACFASRLADEPPDAPSAHIVPVLWAPMPRPAPLANAPDPLATAIADEVPEYGENGLRALRMLNLYGGQYAKIVSWLGERIVRVARAHPLGASQVPQLDQVSSAFWHKSAEDDFVIVVAAPTRATAPADRDASWYGDESRDWRPFGEHARLPLAEHAVAVAERLNFATSVLGVGAAADAVTGTPAVVLVDPWIAAGEGGAESDALRGLRRLFAGDRRHWTVPVIVVNGSDPASVARQGPLTGRLTRILEEVGAPSAEPAWRGGGVVTSIDDFARAMPALVAEAERRYLQFSPHFSEDCSGAWRPRLGGGPPAPGGETRERRDGSGT